MKNGAALVAVVLCSLALGISGGTLINRHLKDERCDSINVDARLINMCATSTNCTYTYQDLQNIARRVQMCAYDEPK